MQGTIVENSVGAGKGDTPRKKVLLSFVGGRDPYNDKNNKEEHSLDIVPENVEPRPKNEWGSILTICRY